VLTATPSIHAVRRRAIGGLVALGLVIAILASPGCASHMVRVTNDSEADLTVRLFVGDRSDPKADEDGRVPMYHTEKHLAHLKVGDTTRFNLRKNKFYKRDARDPVVRLWIESRAPSFARDPGKVREHWIELVSFPPVGIDVVGPRNGLKFVASNGKVTLVPRELWIEDPDPYERLRHASAEED